MSENSESEMLARCRNGDAAAWNAIFDQHYSATGRFVFQLSPEFTREDVEEICTETFRSVIQFIDSFQGENRFQSWLFRVAAKKARDHRESHQTSKPTAGHMAIVRKALDQLGDPCREIIELHYFGDLSYKDIGGMMGLTSNTVGVRLSKCLEELEIILDECASKEEPPFTVPNKNGDELLKSYAKKRREDAGAPMEMPPSMREKLQAEVSKVAQQVAPPPRPRSWLAERARPTFVFALFFALLITAASIWLRSHTARPREHTRNTREPIVALPDMTEASQLKLGNPKLMVDATGRTADVKLRDRQRVTVNQRYVRATGSEIRTLDKVLLSFQVEQNDFALWITDADGSIYSDGAPSGTGFRAIGTNRTLNQLVVFEGNVVKSTATNQIQGRVFVGTNDEIAIDAMSVP